MGYEDFTVLRVEVGGRVCRATIDNPPINLLDVPLMVELDRLGRDVASDADVGVLVVRSANPEFFVAHADIGAILELPRKPLGEPPAELGFFHAMVDRFRTMPVATIAVVEGVARGGGCELVSSFDLRVAARGRAVFGQPEALVGIIPGLGYAAYEVELQEGVVLVCFTDGILEAESTAGHEFSQERLLSVSAASSGQSVEDLLQCVQRELAVFLDDRPPHDDCTVLAVRRPESP